MTPLAHDIIEQVAAQFAVTPAQITSPDRKAFRARIEVARRLREHGYSSSRIGPVLRRDRTTVLYYLGNGKRKAAPPKWRKPKILHLNCSCRRCYFPAPKIRVMKPRPRYLVPYAGAYMPEYEWVRCP